MSINMIRYVTIDRSTVRPEARLALRDSATPWVSICVCVCVWPGEREREREGGGMYMKDGRCMHALDMAQLVDDFFIICRDPV